MAGVHRTADQIYDKEKQIMDWGKYISLNMAGRADFHMHTKYCDGTASPEEMVQSAISKGLKVCGLSGHVYTPFDESYCMLQDDMNEYEKEIRALKEKYADKIEILCGIEQDRFAGKPDREWDYVIGSTHYVKCGDEYVPVDDTPETMVDAAKRYFDGDMYGLVEGYFEAAGDVCEATDADVIGHFNQVCKFNRGGEGDKMGALFDEGHPRYVKAWKKAADILLEYGIPFEINTGGISAGFRTDAYPSKTMRDYLKARGAKFIMSSDSHRLDTLCFGFDDERFRI